MSMLDWYDMQIPIDQKNKYKRVEEYIDQAQNILIATHQSPDGDAIGSLSALMEFLNSRDKRYTAFSRDGVPDNFLFLRNACRMVSSEDELLRESFDLVIVIDCSSLGYTGFSIKVLTQIDKVKLVTIDHHEGNEEYGEFNLIEPKSSSTSVMIYKLFKLTGARMTSEVATGMLLGILTDTSNFTNQATNAESLEIAADLIGKSGKYNYIIKKVYQDKTEESLRVWSKVLSRLQKNDKLNIAYSVVLESDIGKSEENATDGISNFFNSLDGVKMAMVLKEKDGNQVKVSLRGIEEEANVLKLAQLFGGGGHTKSAGFLVKGRLEKIGEYWKVV